MSTTGVPRGLEKAGKALWTAVIADAPELDARDRAILEQACRQADTVATLEGELPGSLYDYGRMTPIVSELRQARLALTRLLGSVGMPRRGSGTTAASEKARAAAEARWGKREAA